MEVFFFVSLVILALRQIRREFTFSLKLKCIEVANRMHVISSSWSLEEKAKTTEI